MLDAEKSLGPLPLQLDGGTRVMPVIANIGNEPRPMDYFAAFDSSLVDDGIHVSELVELVSGLPPLGSTQRNDKLLQLSHGERSGSDLSAAHIPQQI